MINTDYNNYHNGDKRNHTHYSNHCSEWKNIVYDV